MSNSKLRHNATAFREVCKSLHLGNHFSQQSFAHVRNLLLSIPLAYFFKIRDCRCRECDLESPRHDFNPSRDAF